MKSLFSNILKFSAISTLAVCSLSACSDDSSTNSNSEQNTSTITPPVEEIPAPTPISPIVINKMSTQPNGERSVFVISGGAGLDLNDTTSIPKGAEVYYMDLKISINKVVGDQLVGTPLQVTCQGQPCKLTNPNDKINLAELGARVEDYNRSDCGTFRITASYFASYDGNNPHMFIDNDSYDFVREESACEAPVENTTPVETPQSKIVLTAYTVVVGTKKGEGLSLATGTVVPLSQADIIFSSEDDTGALSVSTANGAKITPYSNNSDNNWDDDWSSFELPPEPVHMSNFRFSERSLNTSISHSQYDGQGMFYIVTTPNYNAETGDGFYAFTEIDHSVQDANKNVDVTILVYKK